MAEPHFVSYDPGAAGTGLPPEVDSKIGAEILRVGNATYARASAGVPGATRMVPVGDSITESYTNIGNFFGAWPLHLALESNGSVIPIVNGAHGGWTSKQLQNAFLSEVIAQNPNMVILMPGRNDDPDQPPLDMIALCEFALAECRKIGAELVLVNSTPQGRGAMPPPTGTAEKSASAGGSMGPGTYRWRITALNAGGETTPSAPVEFTLPAGSGATNRVRLSWSHVPGANSYKIYKETSDGSGVYGLYTTISAISSPAYYADKYWNDFNHLTPNASVNPPATNSTALPVSRVDHAMRRNAWLSKFAAENRLILVDVYSLLSDGLTGMWKSGYSHDGTHPTGEANAIIADAIWRAVKSLIKQAPPMITGSSGDSVNLMPNGTFSTVTGNRPTGWALSTSPSYDTAPTTESVGPRVGFVGNCYTLDRSAGGELVAVSPQATSGFSLGDELVLSVRLETEGIAANGSLCEVAFLTQADATVARFSVIAADHPPAVVSYRRTVGAGVTGIKLSLKLRGAGKVRVGQVTIYNLTTQSYLL